MNHLVIGDPHAKWGVPNTRFDWLGKLIKDIRPDVVINMGDLADMESLCFYDRGTKGFEGRRYRKDIDAANEALERIHKPLRNLKKQPRFISLEGNHEHRIHRAVQADAILDGTISINDINFSKHNHELIRYSGQTPGAVQVDDISYRHFFTSGVMGRPVSGEHPAASILKKKFQSCIAGHLHLLDFAERNRDDGQRIQCFVAGCFLDKDQFEDYAGVSNVMYRRGVLLLKDVHRGSFDFEWISIERLRNEYKR